MFSTNLRRAISLALLFISVAGHAEEGGEAAPAQPKEKKEKPTAAIEFTQKTMKLNTIGTRLLDSQSDFDHLVWRKEHTTDQKEIESILKEMVDITNQRNKDVEEHNKLGQDLLYRYPSKNTEINRLYQMEQKRDIDEMQSAADLDDMLTRVKRVIERKFAPFNPEQNKPVVAVAFRRARKRHQEASIGEVTGAMDRLEFDKLRLNIPKLYAFAFFQMFLVIMPVIVPVFPRSKGFDLRADFYFAGDFRGRPSSSVMHPGGIWLI